MITEGTSGRVVVLCAPGVETDPDPVVTGQRGVSLIACGGDLPDEPFGVVGWSTGGHDALAVAGAYSGLVDRLVLVATPATEAIDPAEVTAKTLLLYGATDPAVESRQGKWWKSVLPNSRYEQIPDPGPLLLGAVWPRVLAHLAPRTRRQ